MASTKPRSPARAPQQTPVSKPQQPRESVVSAGWSGPLPPPGALQQFNQIIDNGAERIMAMVETEQAHRIKQENRGMIAEIVDTLGGKLAGFVLTLASIGGAIYTVHIGAHWSVSVAIVGVPIAALIGKFVTRS